MQITAVDDREYWTQVLAASGTTTVPPESRNR